MKILGVMDRQLVIGQEEEAGGGSDLSSFSGHGSVMKTFAVGGGGVKFRLARLLGPASAAAGKLQGRSIPPRKSWESRCVHTSLLHLLLRQLPPAPPVGFLCSHVEVADYHFLLPDYISVNRWDLMS